MPGNEATLSSSDSLLLRLSPRRWGLGTRLLATRLNGSHNEQRKRHTWKNGHIGGRDRDGSHWVRGEGAGSHWDTSVRRDGNHQLGRWGDRWSNQHALGSGVVGVWGEWRERGRESQHKVSIFQGMAGPIVTSGLRKMHSTLQSIRSVQPAI